MFFAGSHFNERLQCSAFTKTHEANATENKEPEMNPGDQRSAQEICDDRAAELQESGKSQGAMDAKEYELEERAVENTFWGKKTNLVVFGIFLVGFSLIALASKSRSTTTFDDVRNNRRRTASMFPSNEYPCGSDSVPCEADCEDGDPDCSTVPTSAPVPTPFPTPFPIFPTNFPTACVGEGCGEYEVPTPFPTPFPTNFPVGFPTTFPIDMDPPELD